MLTEYENTHTTNAALANAAYLRAEAANRNGDIAGLLVATDQAVQHADNAEDRLKQFEADLLLYPQTNQIPGAEAAVEGSRIRGEHSVHLARGPSESAGDLVNARQGTNRP